MSAVLRAYGTNFDVDAFRIGCTLEICAIKRKGDPIRPSSSPTGPRFPWSGVHIPVSDAAFDDFPRQTVEATAFLRAEFKQIQRLCQWPGIESVTLDFGIERRDAAVQCDVLPAELIAVAGLLGLEI